MPESVIQIADVMALILLLSVPIMRFLLPYGIYWASRAAAIGWLHGHTSYYENYEGKTDGSDSKSKT